MVTLASYAGIPELAMSVDRRIITTQFHPEFMDSTPFFTYILEWVRSTGTNLGDELSSVPQERKPESENRIRYTPTFSSTLSSAPRGSSNPVSFLGMDLFSLGEDPNQSEEPEEEEGTDQEHDPDDENEENF
jgi:hypothetical protein